MKCNCSIYTLCSYLVKKDCRMSFVALGKYFCLTTCCKIVSTPVKSEIGLKLLSSLWKGSCNSVDIIPSSFCITGCNSNFGNVTKQEIMISEFRAKASKVKTACWAAQTPHSTHVVILYRMLSGWLYTRILYRVFVAVNIM